MEECLHAAAGVAVAGLLLPSYHNTGRGGIMATTGTGRTQTGQLY